ncbi:MAG: NAD(P)H-hydrate epimerase, partial [Planctomycetota bacterium]
MTARPTSSTPFSRDEARAHDRRLIETLGFLGAVLMENAGRGCVELMESLGVTGSVLVVTGKGNNAGEGFVIARHVALRGHVCRVALGAPASELRGDALTAFTMLTPCGVPILDLAGVNPA